MLKALDSYFTQSDVCRAIGITPALYRYRVLKGDYPEPSRMREGGGVRHNGEPRKFYSQRDVNEVLKRHQRLYCS